MRIFVSYGFVLIMSLITGMALMALYGSQELWAVFDTFSWGMLFGMLITLGLIKLGEGFWIGREKK